MAYIEIIIVIDPTINPIVPEEKVIKSPTITKITPIT
jgi:hypothetical protein